MCVAENAETFGDSCSCDTGFSDRDSHSFQEPAVKTKLQTALIILITTETAFVGVGGDDETP
jgi:hypothetical protein